MNILYVVDNEKIIQDYLYEGFDVNMVSLTRGAGSCISKLYDVVKFIDGNMVKDNKKLNEHQRLLSKFLLELKRRGLVHENTIYI